MARPTAVPMMPDSASGVSMTRSSPKSFCRPSVTRNTPPSLPTSSPITMTFESASMAARRPMVMPFASVIAVMSAPPRTTRGMRRIRRIPRVVRGGALMTAITLAKGITMGLRAAMEADSKVIVMGEDVGKLGGVFRVTDGLQKDFGEDRVIDTPLAESGIIGTAVGLALRGYRPVCEIQFDGFVFPAYDQIINQVAKMHYRSLGKIRMPVVIRIPFGGGIGAVEHHSESPESLFAHVAGLKGVACSNPSDAYWMIQQAIATDDPVIFFEPKRRYWEKDEVDPAATPAPLFASRVVRPGSTLTLAGYGPVVKTCLEAAT